MLSVTSTKNRHINAGIHWGTTGDVAGTREFLCVCAHKCVLVMECAARRLAFTSSCFVCITYHTFPFLCQEWIHGPFYFYLKPCIKFMLKMNTHSWFSDFLAHQTHLRHFAGLGEGNVFLLICVYKVMRFILTFYTHTHHTWLILMTFKSKSQIPISSFYVRMPNC